MDLLTIFNHKVANRNKLVEEGFELFQNHLSKDFFIMGGDYKLKVVIPFEGKVTFQVFDTLTNYEYVLVHVPDAIGAFVGEVRAACGFVLVDIAENGFDKDIFKAKQTKRIIEFIKDHLGIEAEYPWAKLPDYAVFRVVDNQKWFAIIMTVDKSKLNLEGQGNVEIISVKETPEQVANYLKSGTFLEAYHMNKKHWLTITFDETVEDNDIKKVIQASYNLVANKK